MTMSREDPAERTSYLRYFYRNWRPTLLGRTWSAAMAWAVGLGLTPDVLLTLRVRSQRTGLLGSTVLVGARHQGSRYVVSMLGDGSEWVKDVRASGGKAFIKRGRLHPVTLTEVPPKQRAPILKAWSQVATSGRRHLPVPYDAPEAAFESIAADYPVFRVEPAS